VPKKIEKDQIFLTPIKDRIRFNYLRGKGHYLSYIWNRIKWYNYPKWHRVARFPLHVDVELSSQCNMRCPMCYTRTNTFEKKVNRTLMDIRVFKKIIDESVKYNLFSIRLSLRGEAFLNKHLFEMLKYAKNKGIKEVSTLTNGLNLNESIFEKLVENGLDWLTISVDGWGKTYESIRKPAKFDRAYEKIRNYAKIKKKKKSLKPVIKIQSIWPAIEANPAYFYSLFRPYVDEIASNPLIDFLREDKDIQYLDNFTCVYLWQRMSIGADGNVLMCQCDEMEENILGNVKKDSIYDIWHGKDMERIRRIHLAHEGPLRLKPCKYCAYPRSKVEKEKVLIDCRKISIEKYVGRNDNIVIGGTGK
jgi:radical SAM protein with 4Fe4S-binding SPASM domain